MSNPNAGKFNSAPDSAPDSAPATGETSGQTPRKTYEARGEKAVKVEREQRERELLEERAKVVNEISQLDAEIAQLKKELGIESTSEQNQTQAASGESSDKKPQETTNDSTNNPPQTTGDNPSEKDDPATKTAPINVVPTATTPNKDSQTGSGDTATNQPSPTTPNTPNTPEETDTTSPDNGVNANPDEANETGEADESSTTGETGDDGESQPSPEEVQNTVNKAKKHSKLKKFLTGATATLLAALTIFGVGNLFFKKDKNNNKNVEPDRPGYTYNIDYGVGEDKETEGIYDGYGEKGMWLSENKGTPYDFASAGEVAEVCDDDECEMIKYTARNQVESYADYLANMPEALQPEGFKGLTILETEKKLESLSDDEFEAIQEKFEKGIDGAFTRDVTLNGQYHNSYMRLIDPSKPATHENMELVECVTQENGTKAKEFFWTNDGTANGKIIGSMIVKIQMNDDGTVGCLQVVGRLRQWLYDNMDRISQPDVHYEISNFEKHETTDSDTTTDSETTTDSDTTDTEKHETTDSDTTTDSETTTDSDTTDTEKHETTDSDITTDSEEEIIKPKDSENLIRIDDQIHEDIANDIGSGEVHVTPNPGVSDDEKTEKPSAEDYQGTEPEIVQNDSADIATPVQELISPENNYSEDLGGAHSDEYAPVQEDNAAQEEADANERTSEDTPHASDSGSFSIEDLLNLP